MRSRTLGTPAHDPSSSQASALLVVRCGGFRSLDRVLSGSRIATEQ
jgi:hypothetical protein